MKYLICYDVSDNKCRRRIAKYLESLGRRLQYSVFILECGVDKIEKIKDLLSFIGKGYDDIVITVVPVCQNCELKMWQVGKAMEEKEICIIA